CGAPTTEVHIAYSRTLEKRAPKVAEFLSKVTLNVDDVSQWINKIAQEDADPAEMAQSWVESHPDVVQSWLQ
ncbi:MAG: glycine betaine ABC transporter substrate-binding protein, partial [Pseudomonadales bacterium]